jgi:cold shock CspA family protein
MQGTVKFFLVSQNYGFIVGPDADYFFHVSCLADPTVRLREGDAVIFDPALRKGKTLAKNVQLVERTAKLGA